MSVFVTPETEVRTVAGNRLWTKAREPELKSPLFGDAIKKRPFRAVAISIGAGFLLSRILRWL